MSGCPSFIMYCDFGLCCGCGSDPSECPPPPPPPPLLPPSSYTEVITVVNAPILPAHPPVPYNQLPPPLPAPYLPPHAPAPPTMAYDTPPRLETIPRQCVPFADKVYDSQYQVAQQPEPHKLPSKRYETPALGMVPATQDPPSTPPALQHPMYTLRDSKPSMKYYSQEHHHQEYILTEGGYT
ncbi:unnamed protein product [Urochloa humidicola]